MNRISKLLLLVMLLFPTGCGLNPWREEDTPTPTRTFITATFIPSSTPSPTGTPIPHPPTPTTAPVEGTASTQINVRSQPSTAGEALGIVAANAKLQIIGKDPAGNWWQILYPASPNGTGWVTAQYVTTVGTPDVPVIGGGANQTSGNVAIIQQQLNVRSGPGTDFNSLGTLNPQDVVNLIGKDSNGAWLQIQFMAGPEGTGWINAAFVQAKGVENLPIVAESGLVVGTGTPTGVPPTPTVTVIPAPVDGDSVENPSVNVLLSATGTKSFQYSGDVSSPEGDSDDWIQFTPYTKSIGLEMTCSGAKQVILEILQNNNLQQSLSCGQSLTITSQPGVDFVLHLGLDSTGELQYSGYALHITSLP